jgi:hypothetical protein
MQDYSSTPTSEPQNQPVSQQRGQPEFKNPRPIQNQPVPQKTVQQSPKRNSQSKKDYKINPDVIPRPNFNEEVFKNDDKMPIYNTNETSTPPPHTNTYFLVNETQNSSCRFIRSSLTKIPTEQSKINSSSLNFGN